MPKKTCAIYARVSTEGQSIEKQKTLLPQYARDQGWKVIDIYIDNHISGATISKRPEFQRLLADMRAKRFDVVLVEKHDRMSRSERPLEQGIILQEISDSGIPIISPSEGSMDVSTWEGDLLATLKLKMAAKERSDIASRMKTGRDFKLQNGIFCLGKNVLSYGLKKEVTRDDAGKPIEHRIVRHDEQYQLMRRIGDLIMQDKSLNEIVDLLNASGYQTKRGAKWSYINLLRRIKHPALTGKLTIERDEKKIVFEVPSVFTIDEHRAILRKLCERRAGHSIKYQEPLLRERLRCSLCGAPLILYSQKSANKTYLYYVCKRKRATKAQLKRNNWTKCEDAPYLPVKVADRVIFNSLVENLLRNPEETLRKWAGDEGPKVELDLLKKRDNDLINQLVWADRERFQLGRDRMKGIIDEDVYLQLKQENLSEIDQLKAESANVRAEIENLNNRKASMAAITKHGKRLRVYAAGDKIHFPTLTNVDKRFLLDLILKDERIEISPRDPEEPGQANFRHVFRGTFDIEPILHALKFYHETGHMPLKSQDFQAMLRTVNNQDR